MLYSLCIKFQVELEIFKINLKIVFCVKHFISSELGSSTKRDQGKNLKMHSNDIITNISHQFHENSVNTIIVMQTEHEALLVIIDSFCPQLQLFCEIFISSEYF